MRYPFLKCLFAIDLSLYQLMPPTNYVVKRCCHKLWRYILPGSVLTTDVWHSMRFTRTEITPNVNLLMSRISVALESSYRGGLRRCFKNSGISRPGDDGVRGSDAGGAAGGGVTGDGGTTGDRFRGETRAAVWGAGGSG